MFKQEPLHWNFTFFSQLYFLFFPVLCHLWKSFFWLDLLPMGDKSFGSYVRTVIVRVNDHKCEESMANLSVLETLIFLFRKRQEKTQNLWEKKSIKTWTKGSVRKQIVNHSLSPKFERNWIWALAYCWQWQCHWWPNETTFVCHHNLHCQSITLRSIRGNIFSQNLIKTGTCFIQKLIYAL